DDVGGGGEYVEVFEDDRRIEQRGAVVEDQHRHLAKRILLADRIRRILRGSRLDFDLTVKAEHADRDTGLAAERRTKTGTQRHHRQTPSFLAATGIQRRSATATTSIDYACGPLASPARNQPVMTRITAFGPLPFLSGSTSH